MLLQCILPPLQPTVGCINSPEKPVSHFQVSSQLLTSVVGLFCSSYFSVLVAFAWWLAVCNIYDSSWAEWWVRVFLSVRWHSSLSVEHEASILQRQCANIVATAQHPTHYHHYPVLLPACFISFFFIIQQHQSKRVKTYFLLRLLIDQFSKNKQHQLFL